jgi:ferredoxin-type protein NapG
MERRSLLRRVSTGFALLVASALPYGVLRVLSPDRVKPTRNYLRPPGALKYDAAFVAACIGCGLCGEVCPPRCILFHSHDGATKINTPFIDPEDKGCILCSKCMDVCPTDALSTMPRDKINMGLAEIDRAACYPWVDKGICGACVSICPVGSDAISFENWNQYRPVINDGCVGCGMCVEVCPHPSVPIWILDRPKGQAVSEHRA